MLLLIDSDAPDHHSCRHMCFQWSYRSLFCSFISLANGALAFLRFFCCLLLISGLLEWSQEYSPQPFHKSCCLPRLYFRLCLCFFFDMLVSFLGAIVRVKCFFSLLMMSRVYPKMPN